MQIEVGIVLIVLGFLTPIVIFIVWRRVKARRLKLKLKQGEIFDKEGERFGFVEEGKQYEIKLPRLINNRQGFKSFQESKGGNKCEILFFFEDPSKRKLKIIPSIADIATDISKMENSLMDDDQQKNKQQIDSNKKLEPIPEEEEKLQDLSNSQNNQQLNGDRSLVIQADISEIMEDRKKTPAFNSKGVVNFYDSASDDRSMLQEIMSQDSMQNLDQSQISQKQPQVIYKSSPFKNHNLSNIQDKSTDCIMSNSKDRQNYLKPSNIKEPPQVNSNNQPIFTGDESSMDGRAFDEKINTEEKQPYCYNSSNHQQRTKKLFQKQSVRPNIYHGEFSNDDIDIDDECDITAELQLINIQKQS